jgi:hypothetical protein
LWTRMDPAEEAMDFFIRVFLVASDVT